MRMNRAPATVVICCGTPKNVRAADFPLFKDVTGLADVPVTWVCRRDVMAAALDAAGGAAGHEVALELNAMQLACRPALRRELAAARDLAGGPTSAVAAGMPCLDHRALLVEHGIQTLAVGGFAQAGRSSRRPPPAGWQCRSVVWGLWEVQTVPRPPRPAMAWMLAGLGGPRLAPGSLTVVHVDPATIGDRQAKLDLERLVHWIGRQRSGVRAVRLGDLPQLLRSGGQPESGSILRQAA